MLASEPVGGRSRATELPCFIMFMYISVENKYFWFYHFLVHIWLSLFFAMFMVFVSFLWLEYGPVAKKIKNPKKSSSMYICQHCLVHLGDIGKSHMHYDYDILLSYIMIYYYHTLWYITIIHYDILLSCIMIYYYHTLWYITIIHYDILLSYIMIYYYHTLWYITIIHYDSHLIYLWAANIPNLHIF